MPRGKVVNLQHELAVIWIENVADGKLRIQIEPRDRKTHFDRLEYVTEYPLGLIQIMLESEGPTFLCDEIAREEDPTYGPLNADLGLLSFVPESSFENKRS